MTNQAPDALNATWSTQLSNSAGESGAKQDKNPLIVFSKLQPPAARRGTVIRQELLDRLSEDNATKLVAVVAPTGWGKTSLLAQWCRASETGRTAWVSLDQGDNDPARFWAHILAAMNRAAPEIGFDALQVLTVSGVNIVDDLLPHMINGFAQIPARVSLIVDDYHVIFNQAIHDSVEFLVEHLPASLRLVLAARSDPALPLARLRARGEMTELRAEELRFTEAETARLLRETLDLDLQPEHVRVLQQRTEGWAAGVYLAGLSLCGHKDVDRQVRAFAGDNRQIVDYLVAEVLDQQPAHIRSFLMRTAVLDRLCGRLCDAVTGEGGSQRILEQMERSNLFVVSLDASRGWYRYHTLFGDMLRRELDRSEPGLAPLLHRRASEWHREYGTAAEAISHAIAASDLADARELIASRWDSYLNEGLAGTVESWLNSLPPDMVTEDSRLCLTKAWLASHTGRLDEVEPWVQAAESATQGTFADGPSSVESAASMLRADTFHMVGDLAGAESANRRALELEATGTARWRVVALAGLGASLCWQGRDAEACEILKQVTEPVHPPADNLASLWALGCLAAVSLRRGNVGCCERFLEKATDLADQHGLNKYRETATAVLTSADLHEGRGQLLEAEEEALRGLELAQRGQARLETAIALLCLARIKARSGKGGEALARLSAAREVIYSCAAPGILPDIMTSTERSASQHPPLAPQSSRGASGRRPDGLTDREAQVLGLLATGKSNHEIAADLVVSVHTVERHLQNAYRKVGVRNRGQAAAYIVRTAQLPGA
jgi:LuxR family maltose regulon positive regulatory protein